MHQHSHTRAGGRFRSITHELRRHVPFTLFGALTGIVIAVLFVYTGMPRQVSRVMFSICHPGHVFLSALVTAGMFRLHGKRSMLATLLVGYVGAVGIGTLSDSLIPYLSELLLGIHDEHVHAHVHLGFIEEWYLVNPMALLGVAIAYWRPTTKTPHAGHVLLSTWASLFHVLMAISHEGGVGVVTGLMIPVVLFFAVWLPCCTSDIVFPLLFVPSKQAREVGENQPT